MKTTIDIPEDMVQHLETIAARRRTTVEALVLEGLKLVSGRKSIVSVPEAAMSRLRAGYHLGGKPLSRDQTHER